MKFNSDGSIKKHTLNHFNNEIQFRYNKPKNFEPKITIKKQEIKSLFKYTDTIFTLNPYYHGYFGTFTDYYYRLFNQHKNNEEDKIEYIDEYDRYFERYYKKQLVDNETIKQLESIRDFLITIKSYISNECSVSINDFKISTYNSMAAHISTQNRYVIVDMYDESYKNHINNFIYKWKLTDHYLYSESYFKNKLEIFI